MNSKSRIVYLAAGLEMEVRKLAPEDSERMCNCADIRCPNHLDTGWCGRPATDVITMESGAKASVCEACLAQFTFPVRRVPRLDLDL